MANDFIGRHQALIEVKKLLGTEVSQLKNRLAINNDLVERNEVEEKLKKVEDYINSDLYFPLLDVQQSIKDLKLIYDLGARTCVFENDRELNEKIDRLYLELIEHEVRRTKESEVDKLGKDWLRLQHFSQSLIILDLGGLLTTADEQMALILTMLYRGWVPAVIAMHGSETEVRHYVEKFHKFVNTVYQEGRIDRESFNTAEREIEKVIPQYKKYEAAKKSRT